MSKTIDGIKFTDLSKIGKGASVGNINKVGITSEDVLETYVRGGEEYRNIQSVLIDWNGAEMPNADIETGEGDTINTTGKLLSMIDKMQEQIFILSTAVNALIAKVG